MRANFKSKTSRAEYPHAANRKYKMSPKKNSLILDRRNSALKAFLDKFGRSLLFCITAIPTIAVVFIIFFITVEALPFFSDLGKTFEFFTSTDWSPSQADPHFGALAIFFGTAMVTIGSCAVAIPLGITTAICLNEIVSANVSKIFKPIVELLAAIPSVAYGFFAIVVFAPVLQNHGGALIAAAIAVIGIPMAIIAAFPVGELLHEKIFRGKGPKFAPFAISIALFAGAVCIAAKSALGIEVSSGTNALNASIVLAIMALPTIISISQDALAAVGRDMREGSLALGATRFETIFKVVLPCAKSGIAVAVILGLMRVVGETMVVWMASGNALKIPEPFYNFLEPVRTLTATIAGEMGEADQSTGSQRYHVLFAMSLCLLVGGLLMNACSQWIGSGLHVRRK